MSRYPVVPLGAFLSLDRNEVSVEPTVTYRIAGMYSFGRGLFEREPLAGADMSYRTLFRLSDGQLVMSRLNGWEGAVTVVGSEHAGSYVSNEYPTFAIDETKALPSYMSLICRWPPFWERLRDQARGMGSSVGARRLRVHPDQLLDTPVPLPDLLDQQRVVARIGLLERRMGQVRALEEHEGAIQAALIPAMISTTAERRRLNEFVHQVRRVVAVEPTLEYRLLGARWYGGGLFERETKPGSEVAATKLYRVQEGDFVYNRLFAWKGSFAVVDAQVSGCFVSGEFPTFEVDADVLDVGYLAAIFSDPLAWSRVEDRSTGGTPTSRNRLKEAAFLDMQIPVPRLEEQRRVSRVACDAARLRKLRLRRARYADALRLSVLNRALEGVN